MRRFHIGLILAAISVMAAISLPARTLGADRVAYSDGQVTMGSGVFTQYCSGCHGVNLQGIPPRPALSGPVFAGQWKGKTAADLFGFVSTKMPFGRAGTLSHDQYLAVVSYILSKNGISSDGASLDDKKLGSVPLNF